MDKKSYFFKVNLIKMGNLYGTYRITLDAKRRIALPAKLYYAQPDGLRDKLYITRGIEKCITGYNWEEWQKFLNNLNKLKIDETTKRKIKRRFIGGAAEGDLDKQRRMIIPDHLVAHAELVEEREILVVGCGNTIEIWNPDLFEADGVAAEEAIQKTLSQIPLDIDELLSPEPN